MKTAQLGSVEERARGFSHAFQITYADLTAAATTQTITLIANVAVGDVINGAAMYLKTPFTGGAGTGLLLEVGYDVAAGTDDPDGILAGYEVNLAGTEILCGLADGADLIGNFNGKAFVETASITALFTATGANLSTLTAGEVHIFLNLLRLSKAGGFQ